MAIFSLNHSFIGRSTHKPGSASVFVRYITRSEACTVVLGERMPTEGSAAIRWLDDQEKHDRRNARVIDKVIIALPLELSREQNIELLRDFAERMTEGRASWLAAIHDGPADGDNPHAHIVFRDRDVETGKRVMMTTEKGSTQRFRDAWEQEANIALERAGREERIDKRSLEDQGIDREPQIHVGPGAQQLTREQYEFHSAQKETTRLISGERTQFTINYPVIDQGRTRFEENEERKARNRERELEPQRPEFDPRHATMAEVAVQSVRPEHLYNRIMSKEEPPPEATDAVTMLVLEHVAARLRREREADIDPDPRWGPFEHGPGRQSRPEPMPPRRGPYPDGRPADQSKSRGKGRYVDPDLEQFEEMAGLTNDVGKAGSKAGKSALGGALRGVSAGLSAIGKIAESVETLFDGPTGTEVEAMEKEMSSDKEQAQKTVEKQQQISEEERGKAQQQALQLMLEQRARERGMDRGRGR